MKRTREDTPLVVCLVTLPLRANANEKSELGSVADVDTASHVG